MNITKARKKFEELKAQILADGKVDTIEAYVLLEFIDEYVKSGKKTFVEFRNLIKQCLDDRTITDEESALLIDKINDMSRFLKIEQIVEWTYFGFVAVVVVFGLLTLAI